MSCLSVKNLSQLLGKRRILRSISFSASKGQLVAFLGPNGAGKTTLLRTIMGLIPTPTYKKDSEENVIYYGNELVNNWSVAKRVSKGLVYLPQQSSLFSQLTAYENLMMIFEHHDYWQGKGDAGHKDCAENCTEHHVVRPGSRKEIFHEEMQKWLTRANLSGVLEQKVDELSGGQRRKLEVVRALLMHPKMMMLDEPFAGVDPKSIYELKEIFVEMTNKGITVLISDHHVDQLLSIAELIYVVIAGEIVTSGDIKAIMSNDYTKDMYLGGQFYAEMSQKFLGDDK